MEGSSNSTAHEYKIFFKFKIWRTRIKWLCKEAQMHTVSDIQQAVWCGSLDVSSHDYSSAAELLATNLHYLWLIMLVDSVTITFGSHALA